MVLVILVMHTISKGHQAVAEVNVFNDHIWIVDPKVEVTEIPESADSQRDQLIRKRLRSVLWDTEHSDLRLVLPAEAVKAFHRHDRKSGGGCSGKQGIAVKNTDQLAPSLLKFHMGSDGFAEISGTDQNDTGRFIDAKDAANDLAQLLDMIAVALLSESAEAIEILANL